MKYPIKEMTQIFFPFTNPPQKKGKNINKIYCETNNKIIPTVRPIVGQHMIPLHCALLKVKPGLKQANTSMSVPQLDYINGLYNTRGIGKPQKNMGKCAETHVRKP